jgi:hypothetical protein
VTALFDHFDVEDLSDKDRGRRLRARPGTGGDAADAGARGRAIAAGDKAGQQKPRERRGAPDGGRTA